MAALRPLSVAATALERGIAPRKPAGAAATAAPAEPAPAPEPVPVTVVDTTNSGIDRATLSMARPGPAMKATDLQSASFTPGVPLEAPSKYRRAPSSCVGHTMFCVAGTIHLPGENYYCALRPAFSTERELAMAMHDIGFLAGARAHGLMHSVVAA